MDGYDDSFLYLYTLISHTKKIEKIINLPVIVFDKNFSLIKKKIYNSFNLKNIIYINSLFFTLCVVFKKFKLIYNETNKIFSIKSCQDFSYTYEGIEISKIGYDDYLRFNMTGTVSDISGLKYFMFKSFLMSLKINEAISKKNINCFAGKETQFTPRGNHLPTKNAWPFTPSPRGAHSATLIGDTIYIFGGYGEFLKLFKVEISVVLFNLHHTSCNYR